MRSLSLAVSVVLSLAASSACIVDHDGLARREGTGGEGGGFGAGGLVGAGGDAEAAGGRSAPPPDAGQEPDVPFRLTVLHGVVDAPTIFVCFVAVREGREAEALGGPLPDDGLPYGRSLRFESLPGVDLAADAFRPYLVAAAPADIAGRTCADLIAPLRPPPRPDAGVAEAGVPEAAVSDAGPGDSSTVMDASPPDSSLPRDARAADADAAPDAFDGAPTVPVIEAGLDAQADADAEPEAAPPPVPIPAVRVVGLPTVPAGALDGPSSFLLAFGGCIGGPGVTDPSERSVCGAQYSPERPTLSPYLVKLSRVTRTERVGLQFLAAAPAFGQADLVLLPSGSDPLVIAEGVPVGGIRPTRADLGTTAGVLQVNDPISRVRIHPAGSSEPAYDEPWEPTLLAGNILRLDPGKTYTLVQIGPYPGFSRGSFWNDPRVTIVEN